MKLVSSLRVDLLLLSWRNANITLRLRDGVTFILHYKYTMTTNQLVYAAAAGNGLRSLCRVPALEVTRGPPGDHSLQCSDDIGAMNKGA